LWRFWRRLPRAGKVAIFDRSWYGRVLVERVEGFASESAWMRAYAEISDFEDELTASGIVVTKFWLNISPEEQLRRFDERTNVPWKQFKLTDDDWRNREKRPLYEQAVADMIERTSTHFAPWTLIAAEDKRFARIQILKTLIARLEAAFAERDAV
jgi:polyphosphate kinase 2 (PPK2 family)